MTPSGIERATFRFVAQHLKHCANAVPNRNGYQEYFLGGKGGRCLGLITVPPSRADCLSITIVSFHIQFSHCLIRIYIPCLISTVAFPWKHRWKCSRFPRDRCVVRLSFWQVSRVDAVECVACVESYWQGNRSDRRKPIILPVLVREKRQGI